MQLQINELKSRNTARAPFDADIKYTMNFVEERFESLKLYGKAVEVITYHGDNNLKVLSDILVEFDPVFDSNIRSKSQIIKMPQIAELLASPEHFRFSDYTLQYRLCRKEGCRICVQINFRIRNPDIDVGGYNICEEVLGWLEFSVKNLIDKDHFLKPT